MILEISDEIMSLALMTQEEIKLEMAILLFQKDRLSLGKASELAGINVRQFQNLLAARNISLHYGVEEFEKDLGTIKLLKQEGKI